MLPTLVSLDHFRSRVYRSRLALVLLLILLSGSATSPARSPTVGPVSQSSATLSSILDRLPSSTEAVSPATSISGLSAAASWAQKYFPIRIPVPFSSASPPSTSSISHPSPTTWSARDLVAPFVESKGSLSSRTIHQHGDTSTSQQTARGSPGRLSLAVLLTPTIFPTLLQLHLLWLVRFVAGELEGRSGLRHNGLSFFPTLATLVTLTFTVIAILSPSTTRYLRYLGDQWSSRQVSTNLDSTGTIFPAFPVLLLEAIPTLLSLLPLALGIFPRAFPTRIQIASPSHSPSLTDVIPLWLKAPFLPSKRTRSRTEAARIGEPRRHRDIRGHSLDGSDSNNRNEAESAVSQAHPLSRSGESTTLADSVASNESARLLRLQQAMVEELERAGKLSGSASDRLRRAVGQAGPYNGKASLRKVKQRVALPLTYVISTLLMLSSSISLIVCYALIGARLPTLAPTSATALVDLLALRAELGTLVKAWNEERRRVEGLEFVRRRWGVTRTGVDKIDADPLGHDDQCSICFERMDWTNKEEDGVRLDCGHELHAPCLVPWLLSQAFCPVCHRALRPIGNTQSTRRGQVGAIRNGVVAA